MKKMTSVLICCFLCLVLGPLCAAEDQDTVEKALRKAVGFYREQVSTEGGYLWKYSSDLTFREGENVADDQTVWVQSPGTPQIGVMLLRAYAVTGDPYYLEGAVAAGHCLVRGQLRSGGWDYQIQFNPEKRKKYDYRVNVSANAPKSQYLTTLDDGVTQNAIKFLAELDQVLDFKDEKIHEAVIFALDKMLKAQYPNGAFPQRFRDEKRDPSKYPVIPASWPDTQKPFVSTADTEHYRGYYTFNDNLATDVCRMFYVVAEIYGTKEQDGLKLNEPYIGAAKRLGDFIILAQMPEPQPAWAQQYDFNMHPAWARRFEPPAITGSESQGIIRTLIELYLVTGEKKYLEPIPRAAAYLEKSRLPNGQVARFYELKTNKPLYFSLDYKMTYSDDNMPTHYSFKVPLSISPFAEYQTMDEPTRLKQLSVFRGFYRSGLLSTDIVRKKNDFRKTAEIIAAMDERGAWVTQSTMKAYQKGTVALPIIDNRNFLLNVSFLITDIQRKKEALLSPRR